MRNLKGINHKNKHHVQYLYVSSAIRQILQLADLPVPEPDGNTEYSSDFKHSDMTVVAGDNAFKPEENDQPEPLTQAEFNGLTLDLNISKESARLLLLSSHLKEKHLFAPGRTFYLYRDRERKLRLFPCSRISHHWFIATLQD